MLASLSTFRNLWCSKQEYDEFGRGIIHRSASIILILYQLAHLDLAECF